MLDLYKALRSQIHCYEGSLCKWYKNLNAISLFRLKGYIKTTLINIYWSSTDDQ